MTNYTFQYPLPEYYCATDNSGVVIFDSRFYNTVGLFNVSKNQIQDWFALDHFNQSNIVSLLDTDAETANLILNQLLQNNLIESV